MRRAAFQPIVIGGVASALVILIFYLFLNEDFNAKIASVEKNKGNLAGSLARQTEQHVQVVIAALEVAAEMPQVRSTEKYAGLISEETKGIPADADIEKRDVQKAVLSAVPSLESIAFLCQTVTYTASSRPRFRKICRGSISHTATITSRSQPGRAPM